MCVCMQTDSAHEHVSGFFALHQLGFAFKLAPLSSLDISVDFTVIVASKSIDWHFGLSIHQPLEKVSSELN